MNLLTTATRSSKTTKPIESPTSNKQIHSKRRRAERSPEKKYSEISTTTIKPDSVDLKRAIDLNGFNTIIQQNAELIEQNEQFTWLFTKKIATNGNGRSKS